jgi:mannose-6-phosphate isomerase-like protein (cupin superfamily)
LAGEGAVLMRRVVTGYDEHGNPVILRQGEPPVVIHAGRYTTTELWVSGTTPPAVTDEDTSTRAWDLEPPPRGSCFRIVEIAPGAGPVVDGPVVDGPVVDGTADDEGAGGHEGFQEAHATQTLDYVTVLAGQVTLIVGGTEVALGPGDSVVQQPGVPHDWQNRGAERAVMVGVLLSAR